MLEKEEILLIVYFIVVILLLISFVIVFFMVYQKRKNKILREKYEAEKRFEREISNSKLEIQEQTLKNVGWELHDNIGQLLLVAKIQLNMFGNAVPEQKKEQLKEIDQTMATALQETRALSKSLNSEMIGFLGLEASIKNELDRFNRLNVLETSLKITGEKTEIDPKNNIILYRILQEFFSNVIKHAKAEKLMVSLNYGSDQLRIEAEDNGKGFVTEEIEKSSGLVTMESRAKLVGAEFKLKSTPEKGTKISVNYPYQPV